MVCECECGHHHEWDTDDEALRVDLANRPIAPLPLRKRQRLDAAAASSVADLQSGIAALRVSAPAPHDSSSESEGDDDRLARDARAAARARELSSLTGGRGAGAADVEHGHGGGGGDEADEQAWDHWLSQHADPLEVSRDPDRTAGEAPDESTKTTNSLDPGSTTSESPPTSPALSASHGRDGKKPGEPILFGGEGQRIVKSLATASSFSPAGLFGGLGLATLHPSLAPPAAERHFDEDEDGDEDSYGVVDRTRPPVEPSMSSQVAATALGLGESNKKKRKIPGLNLAQGMGREGDAVDDFAPVEASAPTVPGEFKPANGPLAPVNPPTTAEAALAKLRVRPPHVSLCDACISARRRRRKRLRSTAAKQHPLALPDAPAFVPPAMPKEGPPPLPPGSGLKGSKAIKLAMKAAKEREKEKERIRKLFAHVRLPDLFDPQGTANPPPSVVTRAIKADLDRRRKDGMPPGDDDDVRAASLVHATPRALDLFVFSERPPPVIESRWNAVNDQKERLRAAKERAARAREEEERRRREKEEKERVEAAVAAEDPPAPPAAPTVAPVPTAHAPARRTPSATPRPAAALPAPAPAPAPLPPAPVAAPASLPPAPPPSAALPAPPAPPLPPTPTRKPAAKKGRKKRAAHANALNVHHRDNYIPSRLPSHTPSANGVAHDANGTPYLTSWPASEEALASAGPYASTCGGGHFCGPDEWLCLFCEYELFYGEEPLLYKAIRKRHNILKVRKKAKDRATKATQGAPGTSAAATDAPATPSTSEAPPPPDDEVDEAPPLEDIN
ncbi:hypothetical protein JCM10450v2_000565 [Rhodotorula kratochvilovae]